jgi:hypothetical protein
MQLLSQIASHGSGGFQVLRLRRFVTTHEQDDEFASTRRVIDTVAGSEVDFQFGNAARQVPVLPGVSVS